MPQKKKQIGRSEGNDILRTLHTNQGDQSVRLDQAFIQSFISIFLSAFRTTGLHCQNVPQPLQYGVLIAKEHWTPFRNDFLANWSDLKNRHAAALYVVIYDQARHNLAPRVRASLRDLAKWSKLDLHEVETCIKELRKKRLVRSNDHDAPKPTWEVPLADFNLASGNWFPVPRLIIKKYIPAYPDAVLLVPLLYYQNRFRTDYVFPWKSTLANWFGWSYRHVEKAILTMSDRYEWKSLNPELPRPLKCAIRILKNRSVVHYRVRAVRYNKQAPTVRLSTEFAKTFKIPSVIRPS